jgi:hypothetical protein
MELVTAVAIILLILQDVVFRAAVGDSWFLERKWARLIEALRQFPVYKFLVLLC